MDQFSMNISPIDVFVHPCNVFTLGGQSSANKLFSWMITSDFGFQKGQLKS